MVKVSNSISVMAALLASISTVGAVIGTMFLPVNWSVKAVIASAFFFLCANTWAYIGRTLSNIERT